MIVHAFLKITDLFYKQWFVFALLSCLGIGWNCHDLLMNIANQRWLRFSVIASVMFSMALTMPRSQWSRSIRSPWPWMVATLLNIGLMPIVAFSLFLMIESDLAKGFLVAATVPCTMASAAVWTRRGNGDESIPMMVTLVTNGTCFVVAPTWIKLLLRAEVAVPFASLMTDLIVTVLIPILLAQFLLRFRRVTTWSDRYRNPLSTYCQLGILSMVLIGGVQIGKRWDSSISTWNGVLLLAEVVGISLVMHLGMVALGWSISAWFGWNRSTQVGVSIAGGQKTLMVGLQLAIDCGASILPMVAYHVTQLIADSWLVQWWNLKQSSSKASSSGEAART